LAIPQSSQANLLMWTAL